MRIQEFDIVKGIAISCVVFAHALFFNFDKFSFASQNLVEIGTTMLAPVLAVFFFILNLFQKSNIGGKISPWRRNYRMRK